MSDPPPGRTGREFEALAAHAGTAYLRLARILRPGGRLLLSAFSAYFMVRFLEETDVFDAATGVNHEIARVRNPAGEERSFDLWTTCFTPRELRLLMAAVGLVTEEIFSVAPGDYGPRPPDLDHPEWLVVASKPVGSPPRIAVPPV